MTTAQIILTIIEILAVCLVIVGMFNETRIANWERRMIKRGLKAIIRAYDKRQEKKAAAQYKKTSPKLVYTSYPTRTERHNVA